MNVNASFPPFPFSNNDYWVLCSALEDDEVFYKEILVLDGHIFALVGLLTLYKMLAATDQGKWFFFSGNKF